VVISNALPVKFWTDPALSFNNKEVCGVEPVCWCQPFECDDEISIQFTDESDIAELEIETIPIPDLPALSTWLSRSISDTRPDWTEGATPTVDINGAGEFLGLASEVIYTEYEFLEGYEYEISLEFDRTVNAGTNNPRTAVIRIYDEDFNTIFSESLASGAGSNTITINFTATEDCSIVGFYFSSGSDVTIDLTDLSGDRTGLEILEDPGPKIYALRIFDSNDAEITTLSFDSQYLGNYNHLYSLSFTPNDVGSPGICNQEVQFKIIQQEYSNEITEGNITDYIEEVDGNLTNDEGLTITGALTDYMEEIESELLNALEYCYEGIYEVDDEAHPSGGTIEYIDEWGDPQSLTLLWIGDPQTFYATEITLTVGVAPC
jgi:hypothetical protein